MLSSLRNRVFQTTNIHGDSTATHLLSSLLLLQKNQNPFIIRSISTSISSKNQSSPFVVSYLINSCGLSEEQAISASKQLHFETSSKPDSVLIFLKNNGFTKPYISKLITIRPLILSADPQKTLKFDFFNSVGLSGLDLAKMFSSDPSILQTSLEKQIIPVFAVLKSIVQTDNKVIALLKLSSWVLKHLPRTTLVPNIECLRDQGVPESNILKLLMAQPNSFLLTVVRFKEIVEEIKGMGMDPCKYVFISAVHSLSAMSKSTLESKMDVFRRWGWSEDEIQTAFRKQPVCLTLSENNTNAKIDFFANQMGYKSSFLAEHPQFFTYSLEKRIIPRCRVIRILGSKGLVTKKFPITSVLTIAEKSFLENYVIKYAKEVPEVLEMYQEKSFLEKYVIKYEKDVLEVPEAYQGNMNTPMVPESPTVDGFSLVNVSKIKAVPNPMKALFVFGES